MPYGLSLFIKTNLEFVLIGLDIENSFNEVTRASILEYVIA